MTARNLARRIGALEEDHAADPRFVNISAEDLIAGRIPRGWSLYRAIRASYGYDPDGDEPIAEQRPVWRPAVPVERLLAQTGRRP
jgi:hypothetical protein